jgi:hypothetical protein
VAVVCASALPLSVNDWRENWFFVGIAVFSFSFALKGYRAFWRRGPGWMVEHLTGMGGSYIAMATAFSIQVAKYLPLHDRIPGFVWWVLPTAVGSPLLSKVARRYANAR